MMSVIFGGNVMKRTVFEQACTCREAIVSGTHRFMFLAGGCSGDARYECLAEVQRIWNLANRSADEALGLGRGHLHARDDTCRLQAFRSTSLAGLPRLHKALAMHRVASATGPSRLSVMER